MAAVPAVECLRTLASASWAHRSSTTSASRSRGRGLVCGDRDDDPGLALEAFGEPTKRGRQPAAIHADRGAGCDERARLDERVPRVLLEHRELLLDRRRVALSRVRGVRAGP